MDLKRYFRGPFVAVLVMLLLFFIVFAYANRSVTYTPTSTSRVVADIYGGHVKSATLIDKSQTIEIVTNGNPSQRLQASWVGNQGQQIAEELQKNPPKDGYNVQVPRGNTVIGVIFSFLPYILIILIFFFLLNQMQGGGSRVMNFGKSKAKLITKDTPKTTFADVAGADEAIEELQEIKEFLQTPGKFQAIGAKIPKGVLLYGPPGTGKTLLARAVAGEAGVPFYSISGSDFVEMFVGVGASRVRDLFEQAKANAPAIVFVDEIVAAQPDLAGRKGILRVHARGKPFASDVDLDVIARRTPGFTGADLANVINEGALLTARGNETQVTMYSLEEAIDRVTAGPKRKSVLLSEKERKIIAYHEGGHALVGHAMPHADPVHKITIIPRGRALGYTAAAPTEDKFLVSRAEMMDQLAMLLGGRTAEELVFHEPTTGAANDIEKASQIARGMVTEFGMSERLGARKFGTGDGEPFLGRDMSHSRDYSEEIASTIDEEIRRLIESAHDEAWEILVAYREVLDNLVLQLMEHETLSRDKVLVIFGPVRKRTTRGSYTGYGKRLPSDRPPVQTPKELALTRADGTALPAVGNGQAPGSGTDGSSAIGGPGAIGPSATGPMGPGAPMSAREPGDGPPGGAH